MAELRGRALLARPWRSVRVRMTVVAAVVAAVTVLGAGWLVLRGVEDTQIGRLRDRAEENLDAVAARLAAGADPQAAAEAGSALGPLTILDEHGDVVAAAPIRFVNGKAVAEQLALGAGVAGGATLESGSAGGGDPGPLTSAGDFTLPASPDGARSTVHFVVTGAYEEVTRSVGTPRGRLTVVAGAPVDEVQRSLDAVRRSLVLGLPALVAAVAALAWLMVGRALRPVESIRREVEAITGSSMHRRVPEPGSDDEIGRLARTMNAMLGRLQGAAIRQRQFASDASHELRSPVAAIRTDVEVALREGGGADWPAVGRAVLVEEDRLERLLADLLLLAADDEGGRSADGPVDLGAVATAEAERGRRVPVTVTVDGAPPPVAGSADALGRAVANLVDNAARHARTEVRVAVRSRDAGVRLVVDDDGPGIPAADRERVFQRFARLDDGRARDAGGAGLGLAVVRSIVARHGGRVHAEGAPLGGARLVVDLPVGVPSSGAR